MTDLDHSGVTLLDQVSTFLQEQDDKGLASFIEQNCSTEQLAALLESKIPEVVQLAAICLGIEGDFQGAHRLTPLLQHDDPAVVRIAEYVIRGLWFKSSPAACRPALQEADSLIRTQHYPQAVRLLDRLAEECPDCPEIYHQRAVAHYLNGHYFCAIADCQKALNLNPDHFDVMAYLGHCYAQLGRLEDALRWYRHVMKLHPRLDGMRQAVRRVKNLSDLSNACSRSFSRPAIPARRSTQHENTIRFEPALLRSVQLQS